MASLQYQSQKACQVESYGGCTLSAAGLQWVAGRRDQVHHPHRNHQSRPGSAFSSASLINRQ